MASTATWTLGPQDASGRGSWSSHARYAPSDFVTLLWRERWLMLLVFLVILAGGLFFALRMHKTYTAYSSVLVRLGQEYVYEPRAGDAGRGAAPDGNAVVLSETQILNSAQLRERTIRRVGLGVIYPDLKEKYDAAPPAEQAEIMSKAIDQMAKKLEVGTGPDNPAIIVSFENEDPEVASQVLNTFLEEYLSYRRTVLISPASPVIERQRMLFEDRLAQADTAYQQFLTGNGIGDFAAQKTALTQMQAQIDGQKYTVEAQLQERSGRLAALNSQLAGIPAEIGLYRDANTVDTDKLAQLRLQREDLLSRYLADAQPVRDVEAQIAQLEAAIGSGRTQTPGARRIGLNPVFQTLQTEKIQLTSEIAALKQSQIAYARQAQQVTDQLQKYASLEPRFIELSRDRDVLQGNVRDFSIKEQQDEASRDIAAQSNDNIRIVQRATPPSKGKSLKKIVLMLAFAFGLFTALCAGLLRMFLRPGLPTPASAARTLELPVLGMATVKAR